MSGADGIATWAILVAAGSGERLGADRPKAFAALAGRALVAESLERLDASDWIDAIVVTAPPEWEEAMIVLIEELVASKVTAVVTGGATRAESVARALAEVGEDALAIVVHDAARPLVDDDVLERVLGPLVEGLEGVIPGLAVADTIKRVRGGVVAETVAAGRARGGPDPAGVPCPRPAARLRRRPRGRDRLRVARRALRWPDPGRARIAPAREGHDALRPRALVERLLAEDRP